MTSSWRSFHPFSIAMHIVKEPMIKCINISGRHSGASDPQEVGNVTRGQGVRSDQNPVKTIVYWMLVLLQTILGLHPAGALRATRFVPDESVTSMTELILNQMFPKHLQ